VNEIMIASNTIQATNSPGGANVRITEQPGTDRPPGLCSITGNVIGSQEVNVHLSGCYGIVLTGNSIYSCTKRNLLVEDSRLINLTGNSFRRHTPKYGTGVRFERSTDCLISSCQFHDESATGQESKASLLEISDCQRININGNQFVDGTPYGIDVKHCTDVRIADCMVTEQRKPGVAAGAIRFSGPGARNDIRSNTLSGPLDLDKASGVEAL
ncbi:MAG: right-handed parallel beta-helix repeat-containing protein, partial [Verrucomicrobiota bacterium]